jgi:hypothetical protein
MKGLLHSLAVTWQICRGLAASSSQLLSSCDRCLLCGFPRCFLPSGTAVVCCKGSHARAWCLLCRLSTALLLLATLPLRFLGVGDDQAAIRTLPCWLHRVLNPGRS